MLPKGTIYDFKRGKNHGEFLLILPWFVKLVFQFLRGIGGGLIALAFLIFSFSYGPIIEQEIGYELGLTGKDLPYQENIVELAQAEETLAVQQEANSYGVNSYFSVVIPKIEAYSNIIANVDANDKEAYLSALQQGVAHAKGTHFPGQDDKIFLFSHSTDSPLNFAKYNAIFYLLKKLEKGDRIIIYFADKRYVYEVSEKVVVDADDTSWLTSKDKGEKLILMTCDPPGTTWKRLLVLAEPITI